MNNTNDPFSDVITNLKSIVIQTNKLTAPINTLSQKITTVDAIANNINNIFTDIDNTVDAINDAKIACAALSSVPVVDAIAEPALDVLNEVYATATQFQNDISPYKADSQNLTNLLNDAKNGITDLQIVVSNINSNLPDYINTVLILNCLLEIAKPLAEVMDTTDVGNRLETMISTYNEIKTDVSETLDPLTKLILDILKFINDLISNIDKINQYANAIENATSNLSKVSGVLSPIKEGFDKVESAISPVKWAMHAAGCIVNKVFSPVINKVLEVTGLKSLTNGLSNELNKYLDLDQAIQNIESVFKGTFLSQLQSLSSSNTTNYSSQLTNQWSNSNKALGKYSPSNNDNNKTEIIDLLNAIGNGAVDPNQPTPIPNWPDAPNFNNSNTALNAFTFQNIIKSPSKKNNFVVTKSTAKTYSNSTVQELSTKANKTIGKINALIPSINKLESQVLLFNQTLVFPSNFNTQVNIYLSFINSIKDLLSFLGGFTSFSTLFQPLINVANQQEGECNNLNTSINNLNKATTNLDNAISIALSNTPTSSLISSTINIISSWPDNADTLLKCINLGDNSSPDSIQKDTLDAFNQETLSICPNLENTLSNIDNSVNAININITNIQGEISTFLIAFQNISKDGNLIQVSSLSKVSTLATKLNTIDSIFSPLSVLLSLEGCKIDANNIIKSGANIATQAIQSAGNNFIKNTLLPELMNDGLNDLANLLPSGKLYTEITTTTNNINQALILNIKNETDSLTKNLSILNILLKNQKSYTYTNSKNQQITAKNQYVNNNQATQAVALCNVLRD